MTPEQAAQILNGSCPVSGLVSMHWSLLRPQEQAWWIVMATALLNAIDTELQSLDPCPDCGAGVSMDCYACKALEWKRRCEIAERELASIQAPF